MKRMLIAITIAGSLASCGGSDRVVVDHKAVAGFDEIPESYLAEAKELAIHYAHTSHGSQIISGLYALEQADSRYAVAVRESGEAGLPPEEDPPAMRIYDGNPPETYITPEGYWDGEDGQARTRAVADTGDYDISIWSWCGQQSTNDTATVQRYLETMAGFEDEYSDMRFVLMTGHTDGSDTPDEEGTLKHNNQLVRDYANDNEMALFDFADIESYDPDGHYYPETTDACDWCEDWCNDHPTDCEGLPSGCAHSHPFNCMLKAKATWYLMARLAGWSGIKG